MGPAYRVWDLAFLRWGGSLGLLIIIPESGREWLMAAGIACTAVTGQLLMNQGFKYCKSWEGSMYLIAGVVFTAILGIVFPGELINWHFWAGGVLILLSVISLQLTSARQTIRT